MSKTVVPATGASSVLTVRVIWQLASTKAIAPHSRNPIRRSVFTIISRLPDQCRHGALSTVCVSREYSTAARRIAV
jgi:hypothetical protein